MLTSYILAASRDEGADPARWILAIDTATDRADIALIRDATLHAASWTSVRRQTTEVLPRIHQLLAQAGIATDELGGVAVATGPGSFTGLRVGMSVAKGIALGHRLPIVGVSTMHALALPWVRAGVPVMCVLAAGRGRIVWQRFRPDHLAHDEQERPTNGTPSELLAALEGAGVAAVVGELPHRLRVPLEVGSHPVSAEPGLVNRAVAVARLGRLRLELGHHDDLATLEPVYVHGTVAAKGPVVDRPA